MIEKKQIKQYEDICYDIFNYTGMGTDIPNVDVYNCANECPQCTKRCEVGIQFLQMTGKDIGD